MVAWLHDCNGRTYVVLLTNGRNGWQLVLTAATAGVAGKRSSGCDSWNGWLMTSWSQWLASGEYHGMRVNEHEVQHGRSFIACDGSF